MIEDECEISFDM